MRRIQYAGGHFFTDSAIADALMEYANVLAVVDSADVIQIPGIDDEGIPREVQLIIGPASQIIAMETDFDGAELDTARAVADLADRARRRLPSSVAIGDAGATRRAESDAESTSHGD